MFNDIGWDENIKITGEHTDFFLRLKNKKWKVAYLPNVEIGHEKQNDAEYKQLRSRKEGLVYLLKKHGLRKMVYVDGFTYQLNNNDILEYHR